MSFISGMQRRGSVYYFRRRVPPDLQAIIGKTVIRESLHERDPKAARRLYAERALYWERRFDDERARLRSAPNLSDNDLFKVALLQMAERGVNVDLPPETRAEAKRLAATGRRVLDLSASQIAELVADYRRELLVQDEVWRMFGYSQKDDGISDRDFYIHGVAIEGLQQQAAERIARGRHLTQEQRDTIDLMLLQRGLRLDHDAPAFRQLAIALSQVQAQAFGIMADRQAGKPTVTAVATNEPPLWPPVNADELLEGWKLERKPSGKTYDSFAGRLQKFERFLGGRTLEKATPKDAADWKAKRLQDGLSPKSVTTEIDGLKAVLNWAAANHKIERNPFAGMRAVPNKEETKTRRPTTEDETIAILSHVRNESGARKWLPWLAAFTGARITEVGQLYSSDVKRLGEFVYLDINRDTSDKSLKTAGSKRNIPLHPQILEEGFLEFVESRKGGPLFPELNLDKHGKRARASSRLIEKLVRNELALSDPSLAPGHSLRHRFIDICRNHGIRDELWNSLTGHLGKKAADKYGNGFWITTQFKEGISRLPSVKIES